MMCRSKCTIAIRQLGSTQVTIILRSLVFITLVVGTEALWEPTPMPTPFPSPFPTPMPTPFPSPLPTPLPTPFPTPLPTPLPTPFPSPMPTPTPTPSPFPFPMRESTAANTTTWNSGIPAVPLLTPTHSLNRTSTGSLPTDTTSPFMMELCTSSNRPEIHFAAPLSGQPGDVIIVEGSWRLGPLYIVQCCWRLGSETVIGNLCRSAQFTSTSVAKVQCQVPHPRDFGLESSLASSASISVNVRHTLDTTSPDAYCDSFGWSGQANSLHATRYFAYSTRETSSSTTVRQSTSFPGTIEESSLSLELSTLAPSRGPTPSPQTSDLPSTSISIPTPTAHPDACTTSNRPVVTGILPSEGNPGDMVEVLGAWRAGIGIIAQCCWSLKQHPRRNVYSCFNEASISSSRKMECQVPELRSMTGRVEAPEAGDNVRLSVHVWHEDSENNGSLNELCWSNQGGAITGMYGSFTYLRTGSSAQSSTLEISTVHLSTATIHPNTEISLSTQTPSTVHTETQSSSVIPTIYSQTSSQMPTSFSTEFEVAVSKDEKKIQAMINRANEDAENNKTVLEIIFEGDLDSIDGASLADSIVNEITAPPRNVSQQDIIRIDVYEGSVVVLVILREGTTVHGDDAFSVQLDGEVLTALSSSSCQFGNGDCNIQKNHEEVEPVSDSDEVALIAGASVGSVFLLVVVAYVANRNGKRSALKKRDNSHGSNASAQNRKLPPVPQLSFVYDEEISFKHARPSDNRASVLSDDGMYEPIKPRPKDYRELTHDYRDCAGVPQYAEPTSVASDTVPPSILTRSAIDPPAYAIASSPEPPSIQGRSTTVRDIPHDQIPKSPADYRESVKPGHESNPIQIGVDYRNDRAKSPTSANHDYRSPAPNSADYCDPTPVDENYENPTSNHHYEYSEQLRVSVSDYAQPEPIQSRSSDAVIAESIKEVVSSHSPTENGHSASPQYEAVDYNSMNTAAHKGEHFSAPVSVGAGNGQTAPTPNDDVTVLYGSRQ